MRVNYVACNGTPAVATASNATIRADRTFSVPLSGANLVGNVSGKFSTDGRSIELQPGAGVLLLQQCGGGSFSWRAQPDTCQ